MKKKRTLYAVLGFVAILIIGIIGTISFTVATSSKQSLTIANASTKKVGVVSQYGGYNHDEMLYAYFPGNHVAYCMNFGKTAKNGTAMQSRESAKTSLSAEKKTLLCYCLHFGYNPSAPNPAGTNDKNHYIATQAEVWNICEGIFGTSSGNSAAQKICNTAPNATEAYSYYQTLTDKIKTANANKKPSFASETKGDAKTYTLKWSSKNKRYEVTITDDNAMLNNYNISVSGYKMEKKKASVTLYTKERQSGTTTISITGTTDVAKCTGSQTFWNVASGESNYQEFVTSSVNTSTPTYYVKVKVQGLGTAKLTKIDATNGTKLSGAVYGVYSDKKCSTKVGSFKTGSDGSDTCSGLNPGTYYVKEITAPNGYSLNTEVKSVTVVAGETASITVADTPTDVTPSPSPNSTPIVITPKYSTIQLEKTGEKLNAWKDDNFVYTSSSLAGAKYEIVASETIYNEDGKSEYAAGDVVATLTTDNNGKATSGKLFYGSYSVREVQAPEGYCLDSTAQNVTLNSENGVTVKFTDARQKVSMSIKKSDAVDGTPVQGAEFGLYAKEDIKNASGDVLVKAGELLEKATSDENGNVIFTKDYPLGIYTAREVNVPSGYIYTEEAVVFNVDYAGQDVPTVEIQKEVKNTPTNIEITKEDITTGTELSGATLTVKDSKGNVVDKWESVAGTPHKITKLSVGETYTLSEEIAPYGYLLSEDVTFEVKSTGDVQKVVMKDSVPTGALTVYKTGEQLESVTEKNEPNYHHEFNYKVVSMAGVTFDVTAAEDIVSADGSGVKYYEKGTTVGTITTDTNGMVTLGSLPLGKYIVKETTTLEGYVLDKKEYTVDLKYEDQTVPIVTKSLEVLNKKQRTEITILKADSETAQVLSGAAFTLTTKNDIKDADGKVILKAGTLVERAVSDDDGKVVFSDQLPNGIYILEEETAPLGYIKKSGSYEIDASFDANEGEVLKISHTIKNSKTKIDISKTDITGENELEGAKLTVLDSKGNVIETWESTTTPHRITGLPVGKYVLREEIAPYGYTIANDVEFEVTETDEVQQCVMKDETVKGKIVINKTDDEGNVLEGAEFEVKDDKGNVIETIVSDKNGVATTSELPAARFENGKYVEDIVYTVTETKAPDGYQLDDTEYQVSFPYKEGSERIVTQTQTIVNVPDTEIPLEEEIPNGPVPNEDTDQPQTGDHTRIWIWIALAICAVFGMTVTAHFMRKKEPVDDKKRIFKSK